MPYTTGDMAKLVGLTSQTLREYENKGLLSAEKSEDTGYRYFTAPMVSKAIAIRSLRNLGFSLSEVKTVLGKMNYPDYCAHFNDVLKKQEMLLERQKLLCELAAEQADAITRIHEICHECVLLENAGFYCLDYLRGETPLLQKQRDFAIMNAWTNEGMFARNYSPLGKITDPSAPRKTAPIMGLAIENKYALRLGLPVDAPVYTRSAPLMLAMMSRHSTYALPDCEEFRIVMDYARQHELQFTGEAFMISRFSCWEDDEEITYSMLYFPVKRS